MKDFRLFLIAGEASGDKLGGALMSGLKDLASPISFDGVGGPLMQSEGLQSRFKMDELSVMGYAEILPKYRALMARISQMAQAVIETKPHALITIDSPDFCLRVAQRVRKAVGDEVRCVHYVAPSVWAWRAGRAKKMAKSIDQVLTLLPFEPPYMQRAGMRADFVGHPIVSDPVGTDAEVASFREKYGLGPARILLVLPGSRRTEVALLGERFGEVVAKAAARYPDIRVVVPTMSPVAEAVKGLVGGWKGSPVIIDPRDVDSADYQADKRAAFRAADAALAASGTVSLELAAAGTPMVVAYDMHWATRSIVQRLVKIDTFTLVNLVSDTRAVPEFFGARCRPDLIAPALFAILEGLDDQSSALELTLDRLGRGGENPGLRAARAVLDGLGR